MCDNIGMPFLLFGVAISAFGLILKAVDKLNEYRNIILNIDPAGERLSCKQKQMILENNFVYLLIGTCFFWTVASRSDAGTAA